MSIARTQRCLAAVMIAVALQALTNADGHRNAIVVMVDDLGWHDLSCQGSQFHRTPNIDRLAARSARFTNGYAACAVCSPTRAAYMTGRYPARIGITDWIRATWQRGGRQVTLDDRPSPFQARSDRALLCPNNPLWMDHHELTLAEELHAAGWVTGHIGKWHLGDALWSPETQGFLENVGGCDFGHPPSYFDPYEREDKQGRTWQIANLTPRQPGEYLTDREADEAVSFIRRHRDERFFLSLCHYAVHTPIQAKPDLIEDYRSRVDTDYAQQNPKYAAMVHSVDEAVGRVLGVLDETGLLDETVIIFTSDNGGLASVSPNNPLRNGKGSPYEGGIRVPWIVHIPGVTQAGQTVDTPIITCDIKPTILHALGVKSQDPQIVDGMSLVDLLIGAELKFRRLFWHFPHYRNPWSPHAIVREGHFKLIRWFEGPRHELYQLKDDLREQRDLAAEQPEIVTRLSKALDEWLENVGARIPRQAPSSPNGARSRR